MNASRERKVQRMEKDEERGYRHMIVLDIRTIILEFFLLCIVVADIILILIRLAKFSICRNVCDCKNVRCLFRVVCKKYNNKLTDEECEELIQFVNNRKKA